MFSYFEDKLDSVQVNSNALVLNIKEHEINETHKNILWACDITYSCSFIKESNILNKLKQFLQ